MRRVVSQMSDSYLIEALVERIESDIVQSDDRLRLQKTGIVTLNYKYIHTLQGEITKELHKAEF